MSWDSYIPWLPGEIIFGKPRNNLGPLILTATLSQGPASSPNPQLKPLPAPKAKPLQTQRPTRCMFVLHSWMVRTRRGSHRAGQHLPVPNTQCPLPSRPKKAAQCIQEKVERGTGEEWKLRNSHSLHAHLYFLSLKEDVLPSSSVSPSSWAWTNKPSPQLPLIFPKSSHPSPIYQSSLLCAFPHLSRVKFSFTRSEVSSCQTKSFETHLSN